MCKKCGHPMAFHADVEHSNAYYWECQEDDCGCIDGEPQSESAYNLRDSDPFLRVQIDPAMWDHAAEKNDGKAR